MTKEELRKASGTLFDPEDEFGLWASECITEALKQWEKIIESEPQMYPTTREHISLELDGYWFLQCKDEDEMMQLLKMWYKEQ